MYNIVVIGAVQSTAQTIISLVKHGLSPNGVVGYQPADNSKVSGWSNLESICKDFKIPFKSFQKINEQEHIEWAKSLNPDIIFAVGFSQLLKNEWLEMPRLGCIGFHPTKLPQGRGRAPIAWLILKEKEGAASFFLMGEGADDGPIFVHKPFKIDGEDDAGKVEKKIVSSIELALDAAVVLKEKGYEDKIKLVFIGDGIKKDELITRTKKEQLNNCLFLDPVPKNELAKYMHATDVGLMLLANVPAFYYGTSPNKFFDYIATGLPVFNNYPGWLTDLINEHECGLAVPPDDPKAFANGLIDLYKNPDKRSQMGKNARKLAENQFDRNILASKLENFLTIQL